jgi:hypothetical protein
LKPVREFFPDGELSIRRLLVAEGTEVTILLPFTRALTNDSQASVA